MLLINGGLKPRHRKLIACLVALIMLFGSMGLASPGTAWAEPESNHAAYTISSASAVPGEEVEITISLENGFAEGFIFATIYITYDEDNLILTEFEKGSAFPSGAKIGPNATNSKVNLSYFHDDLTPITANGEIIVLKFTVKDTAEPDSYSVNIVKSFSDNCWFYVNEWDESPVVPTVNAGTITVTEGSPPINHNVVIADTPDPIWTVTADKTSAKAGETVTVTVADTTSTSWATGLIVTGESGATYDFTTVTEATGNGNNVNGTGVYSFVMPEEAVTVDFTADYTPLEVYLQIGEGSETLVHSYTRAEMEALAAANTDSIYYAVYDRMPAVFMGKAVRYVTIEQIVNSAKGYNNTLRYNDSDCVMKGLSLDGWTLDISWDYLMGTERKYYAGIGDQYLATENQTGLDRVVPAVLAITGWAGRQAQVDNQPYDTYNTYRFFYGQSEAEYGNGVLPTTAEKDTRCTAMNSSKWVNKLVFVVPETGLTGDYTVIVDDTISGGTIAVEPATGNADDTITVSVTPDEGKQLMSGSLKYNDGSVDTEITASDGVYSFVMPAANVTVTAQFENIPASTVWDGSIDVTWYNSTDTVFYIDTPAQLAGLAAIVNGLIPSGATVEGNTEYIQGTRKESSLTGSTMAWTYSGIDDFKGKTVKLTADLDMGGIYDGANQTWSGPNYMPVGGQYMIDTADEDTLLNASFNGDFDGQGHMVGNIYCDRYTYTDVSFDYSQSIGLIGRLGVHDDDAASLRADHPTVRNVAVTGYIYGRRSVGGIAGKIGKTNNGGIIENCANFATVQGTDSKGTGGIVGAGWNKGYINNCYNAGNVINNYNDGTGGISGANEVDIYNCYNVGTVTGSTSSAYAIGKDNGFSPTISNCYWLSGSAPGGGYSKSSAKISVTEKTSEYMKSPAFLADLNGDSRPWVADTESINSGYPILRVQIDDTSNFTGITKESDPDKLSYVEGQTFDPAGLAIWANYSDGTREKISDYTISKTEPLEIADTSVTISGEYGGEAYSYDFMVTVEDSALESIAIQTPPTNIKYASGEAFDSNGLAVVATYTSGVTTLLESAEYTLDPEAGTELTPNHSKFTVSFTFKGVTKQAEQELTVSASSAPDKNAENVYELSTADHMQWFANRVNTGLNKDIKGKLMQDIDLSEVTWTPIGTQNNKYAGAIDGGGHEVILALDGGSANNQGLVGYAAGATINNLTVSGFVVTTGMYAAGFVGRAEGVTIQNCTNKATVNSKGYTAGLLGYSTANTVTLTGNINEGVINTTVNSILNHNLGGIAAYISGGSEHVIANCTNKGTVTGAGTAGGILGRIDSPGIVSGCVNEAAVSVTGGTAGGIAGNVNHAQVAVTNNRNAADITSTGSSNVGGIIGKTAQTEPLLQCSNTGTISTNSQNVGGIVGSSTKAHDLSLCFNTGDVSGTYSIGGILGNSAVAHDLSLCYNTGDVSGTYNIGGIAGNSKAVIADCYNTGGINASAGNANQGAGGIAGTHANSSITNCYNTGTVTGTGSGPKGAVVGKLTSGSTVNCYYLAEAATAGVGSGTDMTINKTETEMKATDFVALIGTAYTAQPDAYPILSWQVLAPAVYTITVDNTISGGSIAVEPATGNAGDTITVTVTPEEGQQLVANSLKYNDGSVDIEITETDGVYSFVMPAANVTVTAQFENIPASTVWDGSIDVTWYNSTDTVFYIDTPAQLAGLAAIVNGTYNEGANVTGTAEYIVTKVGGGTVAGSTDATWIYGADNFAGKTIKLTADLDMGGVYDSVSDIWSGPNYMPIGGQYCMKAGDGTTLIGSSWNGTFDGQGHTVKNIYCSRHAGSLGFGFSQSIGLIGRMGVHDSDPEDWYANPSVKNVAVTGSIYGNRSIGGIVGKNGKSNGSVIENCINYASVSNTDSKGVGGIAGAGWNKLTIRNCANMGEIYTSYSNAGGISGSSEAQVFNSYNVGYVGASEGKENQTQSLGTNNGGALWTNCYWLEGSSASNQAVYGSTIGSTITKMDTPESMKTADFLANLNGEGGVWVADTNNINNGYPVPNWQGTPGPVIYTVIVDSSISGGSVAVSPESGNEGDIITVTVTPDEGQQSVPGSPKYTVDNGNTYTEITATEGVYSFALPASNVIVTALFEDIPAVTYALTLTGDNLSSSPSAGEIAAGTAVTITVAPASGKQVKTFTVGGADKKAELVSNQYTFTMPAAAIKVAVTYEAIPAVTYALTLTGDNLSSSPAAGEIAAGTAVTITVAPASGKQVKTFTIGGVDKKAELVSNQYTFTMPAAATEVAVSYEAIKTEEAEQGKNIPISTEPVIITVPENVTNTGITVPQNTDLPTVKVESAQIDLTIPEGTQVSGSDTIKLPEIIDSSSVSIATAQQVDLVVKVGSDTRTITFSKPVMLVLKGQGSKSAGFIDHQNNFTTIQKLTALAGLTNDTDADAVDTALTAAGVEAGALASGNDLIIWTKHFSQFIAYTPKTSSGGGGGTVAPTDQTIGSQGGTIKEAGVEITFPADAVSKDIKITIKKLSTGIPSIPAGYSLVGEVYEISSNSDSGFQKPVTITLPLDPEKIDWEQQTAGIYCWEDNQWKPLSQLKTDRQAGAISGETEHFSPFAVLVQAKEGEIEPALPVQSALTDIADHWAEAQIGQLVNTGAISGYPDGSFKPDSSITRAEFATVLVKALNLQSISGQGFSDTTGHWAEASISTAAGHGIVGGYDAASFGPDNVITREQMAVMLAKAANLAAGAGKTFTDGDQIAEWAKGAVAAASGNNLLSGYPDGSFKPQANATRAEAAAVIVKIMN